MDSNVTSGALKNLENIPNGHADLGTPAKTQSKNAVLYKELLAKGKSAAAAGNLDESLTAYKKAYDMKPSEKISQRIKKIEQVLKEIDEEEDGDEDFVELDSGLVIYRQLVERLYPHQIEGVEWIYNLQKKRMKGGILADDMGLGKTIQVISALSAMYDMDIIRSVLLVLPLSLIPNWQREFEKWAPGIQIKSFYGTVKERTKALEYAQRSPSVCITTYGLVQTQWEPLGQTKFRRDFTWDYVILDEGHKIKNPSKTTKGVHAIPAKNRLILTGTPIQNNLRELWALLDWVTQGTLLGTQKTFKTEYETPITRARQRGASSAEIHLGNYMSESLRRIVQPYILRRTKGSVSAPKPENSDTHENNNGIGQDKMPTFPKLKKKNDFVIWSYLSSVQEEIYRDFLAQDSIKELLASKRSPLVYLNILKKICDHPRLLPRRACQQLGMEANDSLNEEDFHTEKGKECAANRIDNISDETLIEESGKLRFLLELLECLKKEGHRTLIFSLSRKVLNIIHRILLNRKFKVMRLDGTITKLSERELRVQKFQQDSSYEVFLLTTQVGGVGLTLTAADRVVIFDPSWNPATDAQAVDRIYRIGQDKNVVVYRLITCGTVEEKIYRRQIFKDSIIKQSTGDNKDPYRYFTNQELRELFQLEDTREAVTQRQLQDLHGDQRCLEPKLDEHLAHIHSFYMFGVSDHDLMFSQDPDDVDENAEQEHRDTIRDKVAAAQNRLQSEAQGFSGNEVAEQRWGEFDVKPKYQEPKIKEEEPVFEIEGLYDKLDHLSVGDEDKAVEDIFSQSKISVKQEVDQDHENDHSEDPPAAPNDIIWVDDSPAIKRNSEFNNMGPLEIEESFNFNVDSGRNTPTPEGLQNNDISCIPLQTTGILESISKEEDRESSPDFSNENLGDPESEMMGKHAANVDKSESGMLDDEVEGRESSPDFNNENLDDLESEMMGKHAANVDKSESGMLDDEVEGRESSPDFNNENLDDLEYEMMEKRSANVDEPGPRMLDDEVEDFSKDESRESSPDFVKDNPELTEQHSDAGESELESRMPDDQLEDFSKDESRESSPDFNKEIHDPEMMEQRSEDIKESELESKMLDEEVDYPAVEEPLLLEQEDYDNTLDILVDLMKEEQDEKSRPSEELNDSMKNDISFCREDKRKGSFGSDNKDVSAFLQDEATDDREEDLRLQLDNIDSDASTNLNSDEEESDHDDAGSLNEFIVDDNDVEVEKEDNDLPDAVERNNAYSESRNEFVVDDDVENQDPGIRDTMELNNTYDSPLFNSDNRKPKTRRRSTAMLLRRLSSSDESENDDDAMQYREKDKSLSFEEEEQKWNLALSDQSDDNMC